MKDFASAALLGLIADELRRKGFQAEPPRGFDGKTERSTKRDLLEAALDSMGSACILALGKSIDRYASNPLLAILLKASDPADLLVRWQRLERYQHGRHRTRLLADTGRTLTIEHHSISGPSPVESEDLLIAGLLAALFVRIGAREFTLRIGDQLAIGPDGIRDDLCRSTRTSTWTVGWAYVVPTIVAPALMRNPTNLEERVLGHLASDPGRSWKIVTVAKALHLSNRSRQRGLAAHGTTFRTLLRTARAVAASRLLANAAYPLAAVGYACGYADQAHFSREFKSRFNMSPRDYASMVR